MFIYIHLPFCLSHCIYCDFYVELKATSDRRRSYLDALLLEIRHYLGKQANPPVQTIYLGGGTPGLFSAEEIGEILSCIREYAELTPDIEITLEANPEGMANPPTAYKAVGINRLSIGVQSLQPNELKRLSRVHSQEQVYRFLGEVKAAGFDNLSLDLMYGIPEQTQSSWQDTLEQVVSLEVSHISMYGLKVEEDTRLDRLISTGRMAVPPDEETVEMYFQGIEFLEQHGFKAYEISNLAKQGRTSRHNLSYWDNHEFWGFGVSAHGYIDSHRYENPRDLKAYLENPLARAENHFCNDAEKLENALIFGLRKREGVHLPTLEAQYKVNFDTLYGNELRRFFDEGLLSIQNGVLRLEDDAIPVSNEILATFIQV